MIRKTQDAQVDHCAIGCFLHDIPVIVENTVNGIRIVPRSCWTACHKIVFEYAFSPDVVTGLQGALQRASEEYSKGRIRRLWTKVKRWLYSKMLSPLSNTSTVLCLDFVLNVDPECVLVPEWEGLYPPTATLQDLITLCRLGVSFMPKTHNNSSKLKLPLPPGCD